MYRISRPVGLQLVDSVLHRIGNNTNCINGFIPAYTKSSSLHYSKYVSSSDKSSQEQDKEPPCKQYTTLARIFNTNTPKYFGTGAKVSIVGLDDIGMAIVYTLLVKGVTNNICMIDMNEDILQGEQKDLQSSALFLNNARITSSKDPAETRESKVCVITTGTYKGRDETDKDYISRSAGIVRAIVTPLAKHSPDAIFIVASDPVDVLANVAWRLTGFPKQRIIGTGTLVDTARFQYLLSNKLGVAPESCNAYIIGEHGPKNSVPVWSNVNVAGVRLLDLNPQIGLDEDPEMWQNLYQEAVNTDETVRQLKGTVSWSVGLAVAEICNAIFLNTYSVLPVSTHVKLISAIRQGVGWGRLPSVFLPIRRYSTIKKLFRSCQKKFIDRSNKVTVVGVGQVGMATVFALLTQDVSGNIVMVDSNEGKMKGEAMDLQHASSFLYNGNASIETCTDYSKTKDSSICVIAAGVRQKVGEDRLSLVQRNVDALKKIVPNLVKQSPGTIIIIASNPVDVLTYVTWKLSNLKKSRVIGSGTNLDSGRFRYLLSRKLKIAPFSCHGYIIGEHGDSSVPVWSSVNIAGVRLRDLNKNIGNDGDDENWKDIHAQVVQSAYEVIKLKGYTSWAIGLSLSQIIKAILTNTTSVHAVTTCVQGEHGIKDEVFLSLPCVIGRNGVMDIIRQPLTDSERKLFNKSASIMADIQSRLKL